jgi:tRNA(fMet)-specific endonuclease VapC
VRFLLDTNVCVYALKRRAEIIDRLQHLSPDDLAVSSVTLAELWFGARKSSRPDSTRASVDAFLRPIEVLPFDSDAADAYGEIRLALERLGQPIGERDLLIASSARSRDLTVVTHNISEFGRVPRLRVEDWL